MAENALTFIKKIKPKTSDTLFMEKQHFLNSLQSCLF